MQASAMTGLVPMLRSHPFHHVKSPLDNMFIPNLLSADSGGENSLRARIVIVEDEPDLRDAVAEYLGVNGYDVTTAETAAAMRQLAETEAFDLAILDIAMPGEDGLSLGRWLRSKMPIGIIYATAAGTAIDRIVGLEIGADDYMVKPYELRELLARVRSVLRRVPRLSEPNADAAADGTPRRIVTFGRFRADLDGRMITGPGGAMVDLAKSEFDVLEIFLTRSNRLLSRATISEAIGLAEDPESSRAIDIRIMRLRKKIEDDPSNPKFLRTVRGEGYIFSLSDEGR
jgi:DNA-binding response OmpR family regulator